MSNEEYNKKISSIIERLENNHHKWYIISLTILLSWITVVSTVWLCEIDLIRTILIFLTSIFFLVAEVTSVWNSNKYLYMGKCFRELEKRATSTKDFNWKEYEKYVENRSFVYSVGNLFIFMMLITSIILVVLSILFQIGIF